MAKAAEGFPRRVRIVRSSDFRTIYGSGERIHSQSFVLFVRENNVGHPRLGITVSRKIGSAYVRNRIKRLLREIFRKSSAEIKDRLDIVVNAKSRSADASYADLRKEFLAATRRICRQRSFDKG